MTGLASLLPLGALDGAGVVLRRAWPQAGAVVLELERSDRSVVGGRWRHGAGCIDLLEPTLDRRLPGLGPALADGASVVGYRAGRRAVVRSGDGFVKALRPARWVDAVERHRAVAAALTACTGTPAIPALLAADVNRATIRFATLPGEPLRVLVAAGVARAADVGRRVGSALAAWWSTPPPQCLPTHGAVAERAVLARWHEQAVSAGVISGAAAERWAALLERAAAGLGRIGETEPLRLLHRDLHAGQVLVTPDGSVGLLDLDTASRGDPALDLGNLLAHLDLDVLDGHCDRAAVAAFETALDEMLAPGPRGTWASRVAVYRLAALARLVGVHAFRPGAQARVPALLLAGGSQAAEVESAVD